MHALKSGIQELKKLKIVRGKNRKSYAKYYSMITQKVTLFQRLNTEREKAL
jgi:hypothetical protein